MSASAGSAQFRCNLCGDVVTRQLGWKLWSKSLCMKTGKMARLYRISAPNDQAQRSAVPTASMKTKSDPGGSVQRLVRRLDALGEQSAGEIGQELWLKEWRGIPENTIATRYCRPAGKLLREAQRRGWVTSREDRNRRLWRVTPKGRMEMTPNDRTETPPTSGVHKLETL